MTAAVNVRGEMDEVEDYLFYRMIAERRHPRHKFHGRSTHLRSHRRKLVDWLHTLGRDTYNLETVTVQLATRILDYFMDGHSIEEPQLWLVGLCSLLLAAKFEERDGQVPKIRSLREHLDVKFAKSQFREVERLILEYFHWNVNLPVLQQFLDALLALSQDHDPPDRAVYRDYVRYFTDISLQDETLVKFRPSALAGSVLYCTRRVLKLTPRWPSVIAERVGIRVRQFSAISRKLLDVYERQRIADRKEQREHALLQPLDPGLSDFTTPPRQKRPRLSSSISPDEGYVTLSGGHSGSHYTSDLEILALL